MFVLIAMSGNTALPALKVTVIKKDSEQVIADRIAHSVKETQKKKRYSRCQKCYQHCQKLYSV